MKQLLDLQEGHFVKKYGMKSKFHIELIQTFLEAGMGADFNPHLQAAIWETVENQIANNNPPERQQTYNRQLEGRSERDAKVLIESVLAVEMFEIINRSAPHNHMRFVLVCGRSPELSES